jgi:copper chaperone CopZ
MKRISVIIGLLFIASIAFGQTKKAKIMTTAQCNMCKKTIEKAVNDLDGIELAELDVTSKKLKVKYDSAKLSLQAIRERIASVGYQADDVKAIEEAYNALPGCCQLGGHD